jgi:hypothetical protein
MLRKRGAAHHIPLCTFMACAGITVATTFTFTKSQPHHCTDAATWIHSMPPPPAYVRSAVVLYPCVQTDLNRNRLGGSGMETLAEGTAKWRPVVTTVMNRQVS